MSAPIEKGPRFHGHEGENTSRELANIIAPKQFCWSMTGAQWITEAQTYYLVSQTGQFIFLQVAFSNLSWPAQTTCQLLVQYFDPRSNKPCGSWSKHSVAAKMRVSHDKRSVQVKNINFQHQDLDDGNFGVKLEFEETDSIELDLLFSPLSNAFSIKDGNIYFGLNKLDGFINMKFIPSAKITGSIKIDGVKEDFVGNGICVHQFQGLKPYLSASQWNIFYFQSDPEEGSTESAVSALMCQIKTPENYDAATFNIGSIFSNGKLIAVSTGNNIEFLDTVRDPDSNYNIPNVFNYTWEGMTFDSEPFTATCSFSPGKTCSKFNVLDHLPFFLRKAIEAFVTRPYAYYWVERGQVELKIGDQISTHTGWIMQELSLISEK